MNERHSPTNVPRNGPTPRRRRAGVQNAFSKHAPFPRRARMRCLSMCCSDQAAGRFIDHVCKRDCSLLTHQTDHVQIGPSRQSQESDQTIDLRGGDFCTMTPCRVKTGGVCGLWCRARNARVHTGRHRSSARDAAAGRLEPREQHTAVHAASPRTRRGGLARGAIACCRPL